MDAARHAAHFALSDQPDALEDNGASMIDASRSYGVPPTEVRQVAGAALRGH